MESKYVGDFRVRHFDCDVQGHMHAPNYIGLLEESAHRALFDSPTIETANRWLPHVLYARHTGSLIDGDTARVESEFSHEADSQLICKCSIANAGTGADVANIEAGWVLSKSEAIEGASDFTVPDETSEHGVPVSAHLGKAAQLSLPKLSKEPVAFARKVEISDVDRLTTATFKAMADYMVEAGVRGAEEFGWPFVRILEAGIGFFVREQWIRCLRGITLRDDIEITTWVSDFKRLSGTRNYELRDATDGSVVVKAQTVWACVDITTGAPTRVPAEFLADISPHLTQ